jgi:hypothetical protein
MNPPIRTTCRQARARIAATPARSERIAASLEA